MYVCDDCILCVKYWTFKKINYFFFKLGRLPLKNMKNVKHINVYIRIIFIIIHRFSHIIEKRIQRMVAVLKNGIIY